MKTRHILLVVGALIAANFTNCGKYDDGPGMSLRTKKARITNTWRFDKVISSTGSTVTSQYDDITMEFRRNGEYQEEQPNYVSTGKWEFVEDKEQIRIIYNNPTTPGKLTIRRLTGNEFWFENGDYEFHCTPK